MLPNFCVEVKESENRLPVFNQFCFVLFVAFFFVKIIVLTHLNSLHCVNFFGYLKQP